MCIGAFGEDASVAPLTERGSPSTLVAMLRDIIAALAIALLCMCVWSMLCSEREPPDPSSGAFYAATEVVRYSLKAPSTAEFCSRSAGQVVPLESGGFRCSGWVDAQNSFGAKLRNRWTADMNLVGGYWQSSNVQLTPW